jgi:ATP-dependent DNA helicase RecG
MHEATPEQSRAAITFMLQAPESRRFECKRVSGNMVGKALVTICAMANTEGGSLLLGMEDPAKAKGLARLYGIEENPEAVDELLRKLATHLQPPVEDVKLQRLPYTLPDGSQGALLRVLIPRSDKVHSILDGGTWMRGEASNRVMNAAEITELSYRRGVRSAESEPVEVDFALLDTDTWRLFRQARGLSGSDLPEQLFRIGLAKKVGDDLKPLRAAVLLFADEPGALLAASGTRADIRVFHYRGNKVEEGEIPNLKKTPKTISGPLYQQIARANAYLMDELAEGLTLAASGFRTVHRYPERVIKEAITNAVIHRDYHLNRDIRIRIFDSRIEIESPGLFAGKISAANIRSAGSFARNTLLASNLREFPDPPNVDAGEGVRMMFSVMQASKLFPPFYSELKEQAQGAIMVMLLNEERPPVWEQVSDWIERNGEIGNADLCRIADLDTLKASKLLKRWVDQGVLVADPNRAKRNMVYYKPLQNGIRQEELLPGRLDDNDGPD